MIETTRCPNCGAVDFDHCEQQRCDWEADQSGIEAWHFQAGEDVPDWLLSVNRGGVKVTFEQNVEVVAVGSGYEIWPSSVGTVVHIDTGGDAPVTVTGGGTGVLWLPLDEPRPLHGLRLVRA